MCGSRPVWSSPVVMARRLSPAISIAASTAGLPRPLCPRSPGIAPGRHAVHCWRRWKCIRVWPCRSCGTARSPSRWRSTPKYPRLLPAKLCTNWGSGWTRRALDPLLHLAAAPRSTRVVPVTEQVSDLGGAKGTRTPGLLDANQTLFQLSYSPEMSPAQGYPLPAGWSVSLAEDKACGLLQQPGQPPVGQGLATGLAGRAVLQRRVGEGHLLDGVPADRALLARPAVHAQAALLLAFQIRGG